MAKRIERCKTPSATDSTMFKRLNQSIIQLHEVQQVKSAIEHRESFFVGIFIPQYAKQKLLELQYIFFKKICDADKFEDLEMDTDSL